MAGHVVVVAGFKRELACVESLAAVIGVAGGGDAVALRSRVAAAAVGARGIVSFGMAGALADGIAIGDWVIADRLCGAVEAACDPAWRDAISARLPGAWVGSFYADGRLIDTVEEKRVLGERYGALAADMESHIVATVAAERGLPFAIVRCVSDEASHQLPHAITVSMRPDGGINTIAMLHSLATRPHQAADIAHSIANFVKAMRELKRGGLRIGAAMTLPNTDQEAG